ncbi:MAG TPA: PBP1A family penicillin-binding protein [Rhizomicrobium sp.]|jgi:penicillin-binding protein 1A
MDFLDQGAKGLQAVGRWLTKPRSRWTKLFPILTVVIALPLLGLAFAPQILGLFAPPLDPSLNLYAINRPIAFTFLDAEGKQVGHRGAIVGDRLKLSDMPPYLPAAFIAMEDRRFYTNHGIDVRGLLRALWLDYRAGHVVAGGSTITQQTAKIVFLNPQRTMARKFQELIDTERLEKSLSKQQILELYLNRIYLGSGAYGVDGASRVYFGKSARDLTLPEAAMLATLTTAPSVFSPRRDLARAQDRAKLVLREMVETHAITKAQAEDAMGHPAVITDRSVSDARNYFLDTAADEALRDASVNGKAPDVDLVVHTTLEPRIEEAARHALNHTLAKEGRKAHAHEGAVVVMKLDGAVSALIGGRNYDESSFNRATQAKRQPGSAFKPFVYLAALESGISPWDTRSDGPVDIDGWSPTNYGGRSYGTITLASALAHSVNTITASLGQEVGITQVIEAAQRLGITSPLENNPSLALGTSEVTPLEMNGAYGAFANGGYKVTPYFVMEVDDSQGHVLYKRELPKPSRVIASHVDRDLTEMLFGVVTEGTGRGAELPGREAAGKTGTTQDYHDAWFIGFTTDYVTSVWVGNDDSSPMHNVTGGSIPAEIWKSVMTAAEDGLPAKPLDKSAPQPPTDENGIITAETGNASIDTGNDQSVTTDDESGGDNEDTGDTGDSDQGGDRHGGHDKSWWDWLFGSGGSATNAHPHEAQPQAQADRPTRAHVEGPVTTDDTDDTADSDDEAPPPPRTYSEPPRSYTVPAEPDRHTDQPPPPRSYTVPADPDRYTDRPPPHFESAPRRPDYDGAPPPPPRAGPPPPPPPGVDDEDEGARHPDGSDGSDDPGDNDGQ